MDILNGIPASPGIIWGNVFMLGVDVLDVPKETIPEDQVDNEVEKFKEAVEGAKEELLEIRKKASHSTGEIQARIFDAHILLLEDPEFLAKVIPTIKKEKVTAAYLVGKRAKEIIKQFEQSGNSFTIERTSDIKDVAARIIKHLLGTERNVLANLEEDRIVVAHDLSPSDTVHMTAERVTGFATDIGGYTSHTAIMARALQIPAVVGIGNITKKINAKERIIIDGFEGKVICNPTDEKIEEYKNKKNILKYNKDRLLMLRQLPPQTKDGYQIELAANIELAEEISSVKREGAEAIGLYRTEFLYFTYNNIPDEEEQYNVYRDLVKNIAPYPIAIRTIDIGGDKFLSHTDKFKDINPDLGWRGIRFCLQKKDIFMVQLRALLRASVHGNLRIMFPMVSGIEEIVQTKAYIEEAKQQLRDENIPFSSYELGVMIEVPSAVLTADALAEEVDFFSIGTNDLIQYTIAVDRRNEKIAPMYEPHHPAVLRLIQMAVKKAHRKGIWVGVCGEMAANPLSAIILLGMDVDELSVSPINIPIIKHVIRSVRFKEIRSHIEKILEMKTSEEIEKYMRKLYSKDILDPFHLNLTVK